MGKMLIIRGATYTPPSGSGTVTNPPVSGGDDDNNNNPGGNDTPVVNPPASSTDYVIFYQSEADGKWYSDRSQVQSVKGVGFVVMDPWETEIVSVTNIPSDKLTRVLVFMGASTGEYQKWTDGVIDNPMGNVSVPAAVDNVITLPSSARNIFVWIDDNGAPMSESRLNTVLSIAKANITFNHG